MKFTRIALAMSLAASAQADTLTTSTVNVLSSRIVQADEARIDRTTTTGPSTGSIARQISTLPGVTAVGGPRGESQSVQIRGLSGERIFQAIDGVPVDFNSGHRSDMLVDPALISRVQVIKGGVSSAWGSGAIGGAVLQRTLITSDLLNPTQDQGGQISITFGSNGGEQQQKLAYAARTDRGEWVGAVNQTQRDKIELGNGSDLGNSAIDRQSGLIKGTVYVGDEARSPPACAALMSPAMCRPTAPATRVPATR